MRILTTLLLASLASLSAALAQTSDWVPLGVPEGAWVYSIARAVDGTIYAGTNGGLYAMAPGSNRWEPVGNGLPYAKVSSVATGPQGHVAVAFQQPLRSLYRTTDGGDTWRLIADESSDTVGLPGHVPSEGGLAIDPLTGDVAVSSSSGIQLLRAGSDRWQRIFEGAGVIDLAFVGERIFFVDDTLHALVPGMPAERIATPHGRLLAFDVAPDGDVFAVSMSIPFPMMRSSDSGATWTSLPGNQIPARWFAFAGDDTVFSGDGMTASAWSIDDGATWKPLAVTIGEGRPLTVHAFEGGHGDLIAHSFPSMLRSTDGARTWSDITSGLHAFETRSLAGRIGHPLFANVQDWGELFRIDGGGTRATSVLAQTTATTVGDDGSVFSARAGTIRRSTDAGATWSSAGTLPTSSWVWTIAAARGMVYATIPGSYGVWRSRIGDTTWVRSDAIAPRVIYEIAIDSAGVVYAATDSAVHRSIDEGRTWHVVHGDTSRPGVSMELAVAPDGVVYSLRGSHLYMLADSAEGWRMIHDYGADLTVASLTIDGAGALYVWTRTPLPAREYSIVRFDPRTGAVRQWSDETLRGGIVDLAVADDGVYAATTYAGIVRYQAPPAAAPYAERSAPARAGARLRGTVPMPVVERASIAFELESVTHVRLDVLDARGERVATLVDGVRAAGTHITQWDASAAVPQAYFVRLTTADAIATMPLVVAR